eukprot:2173280-Pyramimonas_sp.AAC.1
MLRQPHARMVARTCRSHESVWYGVAQKVQPRSARMQRVVRQEMRVLNGGVDIRWLFLEFSKPARA